MDIGTAGENNTSNEGKSCGKLPLLDNIRILGSASTTSDITILGAGPLNSVLLKLLNDVKKSNKDPTGMIISWSSGRFLKIFSDLFPDELLSYSDELLISTCMKYAIMKYKFFLPSGYPRSDYNHLINHIIQNMKYVLLIKDKDKHKVFNKHIESKCQVLVECPYKQLKSIFYNVIEDSEQDITNLSISDRSPLPDISNISAIDILHWPHVAVTVVFPNFEAARQNLHRSDLKLIHFSRDYRPKITHHSPLLRYKPVLGRTDSFFSDFISAYITQLRMMIRNSSDITSSKKMDMLSILDEFNTDFRLCNKGIEVDTEYFTPLAKMPYVRYLAQQRDGELADCDSQTEVNNTKIPVRLQEIIHPLLMFKLKKFRVPFEMLNNDENSLQFQMDKDYLTKNQWLIFTCTLCDIQYKGFLATYEMVVHLFSEHGAEADWICTNCDMSFSIIILSSQRWQHTCSRGV